MVPTMCKESAVTGASGDGEHYSWLIRELCALLVTIISPTPRQARGIARPAPSPGVSPAAAASMLLGASMALMLCGSVTFAIGFLLMPWVAGVTLLFGFVGAVSALSAAYKDATRANGRSLQQELYKEVADDQVNNQSQEEAMKIDDANATSTDDDAHPDPKANLSEKRKALFEPLEPINGKRSSSEMLLPPPDFEPASYPKGWLVGKKRKLVNVDVVESMRRIAIQEMNRKDREINGLNEQLEEDSRVLELLQKQLADERKKRAEIEKENSMLHEQVSMLMNMLDEDETFDEGGEAPPPDDTLD